MLCFTGLCCQRAYSGQERVKHQLGIQQLDSVEVINSQLLKKYPLGSTMADVLSGLGTSDIGSDENSSLKIKRPEREIACDFRVRKYWFDSEWRSYAIRFKFDETGKLFEIHTEIWVIQH